MTNQLVEFLTKLSTDDTLMLAYIKNRAGTMKDYGLSDEDIKIIVDENYQALNELLDEGTKIATQHIIKIIK